MPSNTVVQTNVLALNANRNLGLVGVKKEKSSAKLSSGYKINSAADDAAGLAISEKMRAQIRGLDGASKNTQDGVSLIQVAEGGLSTINTMLLRIRELVEDAANDTKESETTTASSADNVNGQDRQKIQDEINELVRGIDAIANDTEFNKKKLLRGDFSDQSANAKALVSVDKYLTQTSGIGTGDGTHIGETITSGAPTVSSAVDSNITQTTLWLQIGANSGQGIKVNINAVNAYALGLTKTLSTDTTGTYGTLSTDDNRVLINVVNASTAGDQSATTTGISGEDISKYLTGIDNALSYVQTQRSKLGAIQNRLEYTDENLQVASENMSNAESRVRDTDMAKEMMNLTKANIIQQAAISMLAQANQQPQSVLQLLQ